MTWDLTESETLRLLQLQTKRSVAERRARSVKEGVGTQGPDRPGPDGPPPSESPELWRLLSEATVLHAWQQECVERWFREKRGTVKVATGGGKTVFALAVAQKLQNEVEKDLRLVVVVPTIPLMFQWRDELSQGNLDPTTIGMMGGGQELGPIESLRVLLCVLNSAREKLPELVRKAQWSEKMLLVVDECHRANAEQARRIFDSHPRYTLGLSATPEPGEGEDGADPDEVYNAGVVGQALGPIIYDFSIQDALRAGLLTPFEVWHVGVALSDTEAVKYASLSREITDLRRDLQAAHRKSKSKLPFIPWCQSVSTRGGPFAEDATRFIGLANRRKRLLYRAQSRRGVSLAILEEACRDESSRSILFHESIDEIEALYLEALRADLPVVLEHSQLPDGLRAESIEAFRRGIARAIISAKSLIEGFNVPSADTGVIAASTSSVRQRIQSLGRMLRRKVAGRTARIYVLYVRDSTDVSLYGKADWESIIGVERNRYFHWDAPDIEQDWKSGLSEQDSPPRVPRIPSRQVPEAELVPGSVYRGSADGTDLRADQQGNLVTDGGDVAPVSRELVQEIKERNPYGRAHRTAAGHLIVRVDMPDDDEEEWIYLASVPEPRTRQEPSEFLAVKSNRGKRRLFRHESKNREAIARGQMAETLLGWIETVERERETVIRKVHVLTGEKYWVEVGGDTVEFPGPWAPLEY